MTERVRMSFKVKEFSSGQPWICLEPIKENLKVLVRGSLGFDLPRGTSIEAAKKIAEFLGENIMGVSYTGFQYPGSNDPREKHTAPYRLGRELEKMEKLEKQ